MQNKFCLLDEYAMISWQFTYNFTFRFTAIFYDLFCCKKDHHGHPFTYLLPYNIFRSFISFVYIYIL